MGISRELIITVIIYFYRGCYAKQPPIDLYLVLSEVKNAMGYV